MFGWRVTDLRLAPRGSVPRSCLKTAVRHRPARYRAGALAALPARARAAPLEHAVGNADARAGGRRRRRAADGSRTVPEGRHVVAARLGPRRRLQLLPPRRTCCPRRSEGQWRRLTVDLTVVTDLVGVGGPAQYVIDLERARQSLLRHATRARSSMRTSWARPVAASRILLSACVPACVPRNPANTLDSSSAGMRCAN